ncbi:MAG: LysR family transcriptional regulator [Candidatus Ventricola sp.]
MNFASLRYFEIAAREQNISTAAEKLYVSRQALSKAIKRMEEELGAPLIQPTAQGIRLTPEGEAVHAAAQQILAIWDRTTAGFARTQRETVRLCVGFGHNSYNLWPKDHMRRYMEENPSVQLEFRSLLPDQLLEALRDGILDLAVSNVHPKDKAFSCTPIVGRPMYALICRTDPLADRDAITPQDLDGRYVHFIPHDQTGMTNFSHLMEVYGLSCKPVVSPDYTITTLCSELAYHHSTFITSAIFWNTSQHPDFLLKPFETGLPHAFYNMDVNVITRREDAGRPEILRYVGYLKDHVRPEFARAE